MLLSMDRVLQLLAEGKSAEKIAELSGAEVEDVYGIIENVRQLLMEFDKTRTKRKIIIKKDRAREGVDNGKGQLSQENNDVKEIFEGAELSAVPLGSSLVMYADGASSGNPGPAGIGIVIIDRDGRQVGKVSSYIGRATNNFAEYAALIRALRIALYFNTRALKIRTDSELAVRQIIGDYKVTNKNIKPLYDEVVRLKKMINSCKVEHVTRNLNEKADFLARKAVSSHKRGD
jgi:ribonuclease HI